MKQILKKDKRTNLDKLIDQVHDEYNELEDYKAEEREKKMEVLKELYKLKGDQDKHANSLSKDTLAVIAGNIAGILLILNFERAGVLTSKAVSFVLKGRV